MIPRVDKYIDSWTSDPVPAFHISWKSQLLKLDLDTESGRSQKC